MPATDPAGDADPLTYRYFWDYTDGVMGGVSTGQVAFLKEGDQPFARMTGTVSTENNGGFIQMRMDLPDGAPDDATGVRLVARGNDQQYFVHLRTSGTVLPWQYYQAGFEVTGNWAELRLPTCARWDFTRVREFSDPPGSPRIGTGAARSAV